MLYRAYSYVLKKRILHFSHSAETLETNKRKSSFSWNVLLILNVAEIITFIYELFYYFRWLFTLCFHVLRAELAKHEIYTHIILTTSRRHEYLITFAQTIIYCLTSSSRSLPLWINISFQLVKWVRLLCFTLDGTHWFMAPQHPFLIAHN